MARNDGNLPRTRTGFGGRTEHLHYNGNHPVYVTENGNPSDGYHGADKYVGASYAKGVGLKSEKTAADVITEIEREQYEARRAKEEKRKKEEDELPDDLYICGRPYRANEGVVKFDAENATFSGKQLLTDGKGKRLKRKADYSTGGMDFFYLTDADGYKNWYIHIPPIVTKSTVPAFSNYYIDYTNVTEEENVALGGTTPQRYYSVLPKDYYTNKEAEIKSIPRGEKFPHIYMNRDAYQSCDLVVLRQVETDEATGKPKIIEGKNMPVINFRSFFISNVKLERLLKFWSASTRISDDGTTLKSQDVAGEYQIYSTTTGELLEDVRSNHRNYDM